MFKKILLLGLVLAMMVAAHPQGKHRVRRYYYNEDRDQQRNEYSHYTDKAIKEGETSNAAQNSNSYSSGSGIMPQGNNGNTAYIQGNSGQKPYRGPYSQEPDWRSSSTQVSYYNFDQGRNLYGQGPTFQRQKIHTGGYQEFGY